MWASLLAYKFAYSRIFVGPSVSLTMILVSLVLILGMFSETLNSLSLSLQAVQSVNMSHDSAHAQMDVKFRSLVCVGLKYVHLYYHPSILSLSLLSSLYLCACVLQWAGSALVVGGSMFQCASSREVVSAVVVPAQSWLGADQVWAPVKKTK